MSEAFEKAKLHALKAKRLIERAKPHQGSQCPKCGKYRLEFPLLHIRESEINYWCNECLDDMLRRGNRVGRTSGLPKPPEGFKRCGHCKQVKPFSSFPSAIDRKDKLNALCKDCARENYLRKRIKEDYKKLDSKK